MATEKFAGVVFNARVLSKYIGSLFRPDQLSRPVDALFDGRIQTIAWRRLVFFYDLAVDLQNIQVLINHFAILRFLLPVNGFDYRPDHDCKQHQTCE
jgi:hypothetical protein